MKCQLCSRESEFSLCKDCLKVADCCVGLESLSQGGAEFEI